MYYRRYLILMHFFLLQITKYGVEQLDLDNYKKLLELVEEAKSSMTTGSNS